MLPNSDMFPWAAVRCNIMYKGWDIGAALEIMSPWAAVICNIMYNV